MLLDTLNGSTRFDGVSVDTSKIHEISLALQGLVHIVQAQENHHISDVKFELISEALESLKEEIEAITLTSEHPLDQ